MQVRFPTVRNNKQQNTNANKTNSISFGNIRIKYSEADKFTLKLAEELNIPMDKLAQFNDSISELLKRFNVVGKNGKAIRRAAEEVRIGKNSEIFGLKKIGNPAKIKVTEGGYFDGEKAIINAIEVDKGTAVQVHSKGDILVHNFGDLYLSSTDGILYAGRNANVEEFVAKKGAVIADNARIKGLTTPELTMSGKFPYAEDVNYGELDAPVKEIKMAGGTLYKAKTEVLHMGGNSSAININAEDVHLYIGKSGKVETNIIKSTIKNIHLHGDIKPDTLSNVKVTGDLILYKPSTIEANSQEELNRFKATTCMAKNILNT